MGTRPAPLSNSLVVFGACALKLLRTSLCLDLSERTMKIIEGHGEASKGMGAANTSAR